LLGFIKGVVDTHCPNVYVFADLFAGTGVVSSAFQDQCAIITNDLLYSNYLCNLAWFSPENYNKAKIEDIISHYNNINVNDDNYMSLNFADTYFCAEDCKKIGYIREDIKRRYYNKQINEREQALLITSLIYAMDKIAKTCGHYDAFRKGVKFDEHLELRIPHTIENNPHNKCYNEDINILAPHIVADLVYLDPPYNSRQYSDAYHLLENVARWEKPTLHGVARKMERSNIKSDYCTSKAVIAFEHLIEHLNTQYILLSYNNMSNKGNNRSNAKIKDDDIMRILTRKGDVQVFTMGYKAFTTGKSEITNHQERLFLCTCR